MAWFAKALKKALPENSTQPRIRPTQVILHVSAGESVSLYPLWQVENLESHFYSPRVNQLEQYMDSTVMADANYKANLRPDGTGAISFETQGADADGLWGAKQQDDIVATLVWAHLTHGIPLRLCTSPDDPGIGWHIMWGSPGAWTPVSKVCPGPNRIRQIPALIARAQAIVDGTATQGAFMALTDAEQDKLYATVLRIDNLLSANNVVGRVNDIQAKVTAEFDDEARVTAAVADAKAALLNALSGMPAAIATAVAASLPASTTGAVDTAALTAAVATAAADEVAKRLAA